MTELSADVLVIGLGPSGLSALSYFESRGLRVVGLEAGCDNRNLTGASAFHRFVNSWGNKGIVPALGKDSLSIACGVGIGGGGAINTGLMQRLGHESLSSLSEIASGWQPANFSRYYEKALGVIGDVKTEPLNVEEEFFQGFISANNWSSSRVPRSVNGCVGTNQCNLGCPKGAKNFGLSRILDNTKSLLIPHSKVTRLLFDKEKSVTGCEYVSTQTGVVHRINCGICIVAAGTLESPLLLRRSGLALPPLSFLAHPTLRFVNVVNGMCKPSVSKPPSLIITEFLPKIRIGLSPTNPFSSSFIKAVEKSKYLADLDGQDILASYVMLKSETRVKGYALGAELKNAIYRFSLGIDERVEMLALAKLYVDRLADFGVSRGLVSIGPNWMTSNEFRKTPEGKAKRLDLMSIHPHSSLAGPNTPIDLNTGEYLGRKKLYVIDGSVIPGVLGINPQWTIVANALRILEKIT